MGLAVRDATLSGEKAGLRAERGRIVALGAGVEPEPGDEVIDGTGLILVPGLVNGHTHAAMTLFRGYADDLPLMEWLQDHIWPAEGRLEEEDVYWGARLACLEMIRTGTTRFWDMYWHPGATARAVADAGLRATIGAPLFDNGDEARSAALRADAERGLAALEGTSPLISPALAPHAIYTVSPASLEWIAASSESSGLPIHIHVSETRKEVEDCLREHGSRPVELLSRLGLLGPRTLLAHAVWLEERERELIAASGATIVTNPVANMKLAAGGPFDLAAARRHGIPVALGTDGAGSNNSLDLLSDAKQLALIQKHAAGDPAAADAEEVLAIASGALAPLLSDGEAGELAVGGPADFLLVRGGGFELAVGSLAAGLVYGGGGTVVDTTVVAGRVLMEGGHLAGEEEVVAHVRERARRLFGPSAGGDRGRGREAQGGG